MDVELHLDTYHSTNEETDEQHNADGVHSEGRHLLDVLLEKHSESLRSGERPSHKYEITAQYVKILQYYHFLFICFKGGRKYIASMFTLVNLNAKLTKIH